MGKKSAKKTQKAAVKTPSVQSAAGKSRGFFNSPLLHILTIIVVVCVGYSNTLNVPFQFDDESSIEINPAVKDLSYFKDTSKIDRSSLTPGTKAIFKTRNIGYLTFALNYKFGGLNVRGYHIVNILIHIISSLLVYWLVLLTFRTPYFSAGSEFMHRSPSPPPSPSRGEGPRNSLPLSKRSFTEIRSGMEEGSKGSPLMRAFSRLVSPPLRGGDEGEGDVSGSTDNRANKDSRAAIISDSSIRFIALFSALLFASHPIQTQAITYIVQRFASLASMFYLLALVLYIRWRLMAEQQCSRAGAQQSSRAAEQQSSRATEQQSSRAGAQQSSRATEQQSNRAAEQQSSRATEQKENRSGAFRAPLMYCASLVSALLALKTKEFAFTLPIIMFIYELCFFGVNLKKRLLYLIPFVLAILIIPLSLMGGSAGIGAMQEAATKASGALDNISRGDYLLTQFRVIVTYVRLLFLPISQNLDYDYPIYKTFFTPAVALSFLFLLSMFASAVYLFRTSRFPVHSSLITHHSSRLIAFGIFWFFVTLSAESSIIPIKDVIFEHRLYLPSVGFFIALTAGVQMAGTRIRGRALNAQGNGQASESGNSEKISPTPSLSKRGTGNIPLWKRGNEGDLLIHAEEGLSKIVLGVMLIIVLALSAATYARNRVWSDKVHIWEDTVKGSPNKARPHNNLGNVYTKLERFDEAVNEYLLALKKDFKYLEAHYNLAFVYAKQGRTDDAIREYKEAIKIVPDYSLAHNNLGNIYQNQNRLDDAVNEFKAALKNNPDYAEAHNNLGNAYQRQDRIDESIKEYHIALKLKSDYGEAHNNLANAYQKQDRLDDAINEYRAALKINANYAEAHNNLANAYQRQNRLDEAILEYKAAIKLKANYAVAHNNLAVAYEKQGRFQESINELKEVLRINPADENVRRRIEMLAKKVKK